MGPYRQDYEIAQLKPRCVESKNLTVALVGLFYIRSARDPLPIQILNRKALIKDSVTLESIFSDCVGFTPISEALEKFREGHTNRIKEFLSDIEQDAIVLYGGSDERYTYTLMSLIVDIANEIGKDIVCVASNPADFERRAKYFEPPWEHIESNAYNAILFDFSHELTKLIKINPLTSMLDYLVLVDQMLSKNLTFIADFLEFIDISTLNELETAIGEKARLITYEDSKALRLMQSKARLQSLDDSH